jgi:transaldolase
MNTVRALAALGQSIWYDNINRGLLRDGGLQAMVDDGLLGVTSNPTIFEKAISGGKEYDPEIRDLLAMHPAADTEEIIRSLMISDIRAAADILRPVYNASRGGDGFVSIEVSPRKARDTAATIEEARELWRRIDRPNLMVKIPATREGLPAIRQALREGININVTLIFGLERYREVLGAYMDGLGDRVREGLPVDRVASVASVFVSRIDTLVDAMLEEKAAGAREEGVALRTLAGAAAVANTKMIYQAFRDMTRSSRWSLLVARGARVQRPLWGSTGTKNPAYPDLKYVDSLIGPDTVNTVPPATYAAILDHGHPALTLEADLDASKKALAALAAHGIDMTAVTDRLEDEGVASFEKSFDGLIGVISRKRESFVPAERS